MKKEQLVLLYEYNVWANERIMNHLKSLPDGIFAKEVDLGFKSIAEVITHLIAADEVWFARIKGESPPPLTRTPFTNIEEASSYQNKLQTQILEFLLSTDDIEKIVNYSNTRGEKFQNTILEIIQHVVNHGTYHRGNISTILNSLGYKGILTDYIVYLRR